MEEDTEKDFSLTQEQIRTLQEEIERIRIATQLPPDLIEKIKKMQENYVKVIEKCSNSFERLTIELGKMRVPDIEISFPIPEIPELPINYYEKDEDKFERIVNAIIDKRLDTELKKMELEIEKKRKKQLDDEKGEATFR